MIKALKRAALLVLAAGSITGAALYFTQWGKETRDFLAQSIMTTQHRDLAKYLVGSARLEELMREMSDNINASLAANQDAGLIHIKKRSKGEELIKVEDVSGKLWKGKLMTVSDPLSVKVMTPHKTGEGEKISDISARTGAAAGVNGGGFDDPEGLGNGFAAIGYIVSDGAAVYADSQKSVKQPAIGLTGKGLLVVGKYSLNELTNMNVKQAVSFNAPRLIANKEPQIKTGDGGWGRAPRTAVGQREDGTLLFVVIDGRQASSVGATLKEVQDLLLRRGAVNAGLLDGGASSELVLGKEVVTHPSSKYGERRLPSAFMVYENPKSVKADRPWDGVSEIDPGGSYDHPAYLKEQEQKKTAKK